MKKAIIRFKEPINYKNYEIYYMEIPRFLTKFYFKRLKHKGCWDIETIDDIEKLKEELTEKYSNHIPRID